MVGGGREQGETVSVWRLANLAFALRANDGAAMARTRCSMRPAATRATAPGR
ncbi:hypothetical protein LP419_15500 [Massilia sp. H-1]|nr:hypothetical protein LP419_15500 [Massilia sp. H-1]